MTSWPGEGTRFDVLLPAHDAPAPLVAAPAARPEAGSGTVLVVDDEEPIRRLAKRILEGSGYRVLEARDGGEAVQLYRAHPDIDLVLLDMVMPNMSGREAFHEIRKIDPRARVLLSSGFRHDTRVQALIAEGVSDVIDKPYTLPALTHAVARCLTEGRD